MTKIKDLIFTDSNGQVVEYDGSPLAWRVSAYSLITQNQNIFLVRSVGENLYDLPGGGIEVGESVEEALKREALEEAGLVIEPKRSLSYHQDYFYHRKEKKFYQTMLLYFHSDLLERLETPKDKNIEFADWVEWAELANYPMLPYVREVIAQNILPSS